MQIASVADARKAHGQEREEWKLALESELVSLREAGSYEELSPSERAAVSPRRILPMKAVAGAKAPDPTGNRRNNIRAV
eukprot:197413-Pyramimonas_sp.AAC.1